MAGLSQDKTANRVALCSAIFAGFAYVGYAVVRQVFGRRHTEDDVQLTGGGLTGFFRNENDILGLEYEPQDRRRVFLRRLSGSRAGGKAAESILETEGVGLDSILRPLSVRERIRELNLNAMAFTDTLLILNGLKPRLTGPRSLPSSTFHSPTRIMSPVDLQLEFLEAEKALEANDRDNNDNYSILDSPRLSRRSSRRNLSRRSLASSVLSLSQMEQEEADSRAESLCQDKEEELTRRLEGFQSSRPRELTPYESRSLVALLHCHDKEKISRTLVTVSNCAAFTRNQDMLREAGILIRLPCLLAGPDRDVQLSAMMVSANLALNTGNIKEMEQVVLSLVLLVDDVCRDAEFVCQNLLALTNAAVMADWHHHFTPVIPRLVQLWMSRGDKLITFHAVRLLVNLTCNDEMVPSILDAPCPLQLHSLLTFSEPEDCLLRSCTLLANIAMSAQRQGFVDSGCPGTVQDQLFYKERSQLISAARELMLHHGNQDIKGMARKLFTTLDTQK